jgi:DNA-binding transcriptional MerR regulator
MRSYKVADNAQVESEWSTALVDLLRSDEGGNAMTIGEVAERVNLTRRAIRFYESVGLVNPGRSGRFRLFNGHDLAVLRTTRLLRELQVEVADIANFFKSINGQPSQVEVHKVLRGLLAKQVSGLERKIDDAKLAHSKCLAISSFLDD